MSPSRRLGKRTLSLRTDELKPSPQKSIGKLYSARDVVCSANVPQSLSRIEALLRASYATFLNETAPEL